MNQLKKLFLGLALTVGVFATGGASAAVICSGCDATGAPASFLGTLNPITSDQSSFTHTALPFGAFSDWWVFNVIPAGFGTIGAIFTPAIGVSNFRIDLFQLSSETCAPLVGSPATNAGACAAFTTVGAAIATDSGNFFLNIGLQALSGMYAFHITGNALAGGPSTLYSGNVTTRATPILVPEPTSLALLALGLLAAGATLRRRS